MVSDTPLHSKKITNGGPRPIGVLTVCSKMGAPPVSCGLSGGEQCNETFFGEVEHESEGLWGGQGECGGVRVSAGGPLTGGAVVGAVLRQLGQALKVSLTVVTREDGLVVQVVVGHSLILAGDALLAVLQTCPTLLWVGVAIRPRNICKRERATR